MAKIVNICDVCTEIFAGGDAPKGRISKSQTLEYPIPIYSNGEENAGLYGFTDVARVTAPSVTVSARGTIGYAAIRTEPFVPIVRLITLVPDQSKVGIKYLYYAVQNYKFEGSGTSIPQLTVPMLKKYNFPLPSKEEQQSVVSVLDKVNELIALRKEQIAKLDQLVKSRFIELFGDPDTNPMHWQEAPLGDHLAVIGGYAFKSDGFLESGIPVLRIGNINSGHFLPVNMVYWQEDLSLQRYKMYPGDLVMSLTGTVGKDDYGNVCILDDDYDEYYLNQRNAKLDIAQTLNKHYLSEMFRFSSIKKRLTGISRGVRQANISNKDILSLVVPIPPVDLQDQFAAFVEQTDKSKMAIQQSLDKLELLKKSLMQEYFG